MAEPSAYDQFTWRNSDDRFGGLSGIEIADDGQSLVAISDRSVFVTANLIRDKSGAITDIADVKISPLTRPNGKGPDSEGLAIGDMIYVSTEGRHEILAFESTTDRGTIVSRHPNHASLQSNSSFEALAIDGEGTLFTIPERSGRATRPFPVYRFKDGQWDTAFEIPRRGDFLVAGADIGPDGRFYLLERHFTGIGFQTRVRCFDMSGGSEKTLIETRNGQHDNLEGISIWTAPDGLRMTLVSDDNFRFFQRTQIVEYRIND